MKENWTTIRLTDSFSTAAQNMAFDEALMNQLKPNQRIVREYKWQQPGITVSYKQKCPESMQHIDHAQRITGGGIVFHSPGDIVFSIMCWLNDPIYYGSLTQKLTIVSNQIKTSLKNSGVKFDAHSSDQVVDYTYCAKYPTPFEIMVNNRKICGLTIRRRKKLCLVQGILNVAPTNALFDEWVSDKNKQNILFSDPIFF